MGLTDYGNRRSRETSRGTRITESTGGEYTTRVYRRDGELVKGAVYRGDLNGSHSHYDRGTGDAHSKSGRQPLLRSDVFKR